jgi:hypothetical protein
MSGVTVERNQQTVWSVEHERTAERGDSDRFLILEPIDEDWIELGGTRPLNLGRARAVDLTFGTISEPNYRAIVTLEDGERNVVGAPVLRLQHELLERSRLRR